MPGDCSPYGMYFRTRQYNYQGHWRKDIPYLLHAAASHDKQLLRGEIAIYPKMTCNEKECFKGNGVTASYVCNIQYDINFVQNYFLFMKNIRGSIAFSKCSEWPLGNGSYLGNSYTVHDIICRWFTLARIRNAFGKYYGTAVKKNPIIVEIYAYSSFDVCHSIWTLIQCSFETWLKGLGNLLGKLLITFIGLSFRIVAVVIIFLGPKTSHQILPVRQLMRCTVYLHWQSVTFQITQSGWWSRTT